MINKQDIGDFISRNSLQHGIICLHSSFKSLGPVFGGPETMVEAFLASGCTLLVPSFFYESSTYPINANYQNNGIAYDLIDVLKPTSYEDRPDQIDWSMGVIPRILVADTRSTRTRNPHDSFCVIGDKSKVISDGSSLLSVYSPYKNIMNGKLSAHVVLLGVDFTSCTPIHFAEEIAGRNLFRRWAIYHGNVVEVEVGSCSDGFEELRSYTSSIERIDLLGNSEVRIYPFEEFVNTISSVLKNSPSVAKCNDANCLRCRDMESGGRST